MVNVPTVILPEPSSCLKLPTVVLEYHNSRYCVVPASSPVVKLIITIATCGPISRISVSPRLTTGAADAIDRPVAK